MVQYGYDGHRKTSRVSKRNHNTSLSTNRSGLDMYRDSRALPSVKSSRRTISGPHRSPNRDLGIVQEDDNEMIMSKMSRDRSLPPQGTQGDDTDEYDSNEYQSDAP